MKGNSLIIIPTYNESENIELIINKILLLNDTNDILVVDDNSPDGTSKIVLDLKKENIDRIFLIVRDNKLGLGSAYKEGFNWALNKNYSYIFEMDADFSHNPDDLIRLYKACHEEKGDVAIGSRYIKGVNIGRVPNIRPNDSILNPHYNTLSKLNCILASIEANKLGYDEGIMNDMNGNISTCNSTNLFFIKNNEVLTSSGEYCLNGITRSKAIYICNTNV
mgnify:CR=1 FL=1